jgi:hypothetical protein
VVDASDEMFVDHKVELTAMRRWIGETSGEGDVHLAAHRR